VLEHVSGKFVCSGRPVARRTCMLKFTVLLALVTSACAVEPDTSSTSSLSTWECPPECTIDGVAVDLDALNVAGDFRVTFCHATGSETNPFVLITTSIAACFAHDLVHEPGGNEDIFAGGVCED
jgi:hypothetical protein